MCFMWILYEQVIQTLVGFYCLEGVHPHDQYLDWNQDLVGDAYG